MQTDEVKEMEAEPQEQEQEEEKHNADNDGTLLPSELLAPQMTLEDIVCDPNDEDEKDLQYKLKQLEKARKDMYKKGKADLLESQPSMILHDWFFLGNATDAYQLDILQQLGITHILNVTREVPNYHILNTEYHIKYAKLSLDDSLFNQKHSIYDYFEATKQFIDECNPALHANDANHANKILVHCAMGKSRSSSVVIAYLMSSVVNMTEAERNRLQHIRRCLSEDAWEHKMKEQTLKMSTAIFKVFATLENGLNETQREQLAAVRRERHQDAYFKLNEAYYYVKSCRDIISPNFGFCGQLKRYEMLYQNGSDTLCDLPSYTEWNNDTERVWRAANQQFPVQYPAIQQSQPPETCSCIIL